MNKEKDLRMVFWVPYNISEIQKGIQAGHCSQAYTEKIRNYINEEKINDRKYKLYKRYQEFIEDHKTWMIYNGGTTNSNEGESVDGQHRFIGTLNNIQYKLKDFNLTFETFTEPDLNDALTAICGIVDFSKFDFETELKDIRDKDSFEYFIRSQKFA